MLLSSDFLTCFHAHSTTLGAPLLSCLVYDCTGECCDVSSDMIDLTSNDNLLDDFDDCHKGRIVTKKTSAPRPPPSPPESVRSGANLEFLCTKYATCCVKAEDTFSASSAYASARRMCPSSTSTPTKRSHRQRKEMKAAVKQATSVSGSDVCHSLRKIKVLQLRVKPLDAEHASSKAAFVTHRARFADMPSRI